ncbi:hypothetical protein EC968_005065 [Mortierella alpina]|nr:hypothetical protein EC968_005065 [Mortierella alpina]
MSTGATRQQRLKAGTACRRCRMSKLRCSGAPDCDRCVARRIVCTVDSTYQRRGAADNDHGVFQKQQPCQHPTFSNSFSDQGSNDSASDISTPRLLSSGTPETDANIEELRSTLGTMTLDSRGEHFHSSGSGFSIIKLSSRFCDGRYTIPIVRLTESDLRSHSRLNIWKEELPTKAVMDSLLQLYFKHIYPFAPFFIRRTFMRDYREKPLDAQQVMLLNAIFCNACVLSDDPAVRRDTRTYYNRARNILDQTRIVSRISTVQALLLLCYYENANGGYSEGWLFLGMAIRIAHDIGLHRQDVYTYDPEQAELRKRVWWALYIADRFSSGGLGRPLNIRDSTFRVRLPSTSWILATVSDDPDESSYEPESLISDRLLWAVKLATLLGKVLDTMHSIDAETDDEHLTKLSKTQLPLLHNKFTAWYLGLPAELLYTPYTTSSDPQHRPSPATALLQMLYYTSLIKLHMPLFRTLNSSCIDASVLTSSRNICTAAATNICHVADSLLLHGLLHDGSAYMFGSLLSAETVFIHNALTSPSTSREATLTGLFKIIKASSELSKTYPFSELMPAMMIDLLSCQNRPVPQDVEAIFYEISNFLELSLDPTHFQSITNMNVAARMAKFSMEGSGQAPSIEVRHSNGLFSMPLPDYTKGQQAEDMSTMWQVQMAKAANLVIAAFGSENPQNEQRLYDDPLELPQDLRLAPIEELLFADLSLPFEASPQELGP